MDASPEDVYKWSWTTLCRYGCEETVPLQHVLGACKKNELL